jgi:hypothetical protein
MGRPCWHARPWPTELMQAKLPTAHPALLGIVLLVY